VIILVNGDPDRWQSFCSSIEVVDRFGVPYAMPYETNRPIFICRGLRTDLAATWYRFKRYNSRFDRSIGMDRVPRTELSQTKCAMESEPKVRAEHTTAAIRRSVTRLARRLRLERAYHGVSASKLIVLGHLKRSGVMTAKELATLEHVQPQSLTRILADLEKTGLIRRDRAEIDRRQVRIEISKKGRGLLVFDARKQDAWL